MTNLLEAMKVFSIIDDKSINSVRIEHVIDMPQYITDKEMTATCLQPVSQLIKLRYSRNSNLIALVAVRTYEQLEIIMDRFVGLEALDFNLRQSEVSETDALQIALSRPTNEYQIRLFLQNIKAQMFEYNKTLQPK